MKVMTSSSTACSVSGLDSRYQRVRDIILSRDLENLELLRPRLQALYDAYQILRERPPTRENAHWKVRGSALKGEFDSDGRQIYVWHRATPQSCTCGAYYAGQTDTIISPITCKHRMAAWMMQTEV